MGRGGFGAGSTPLAGVVPQVFFFGITTLLIFFGILKIIFGILIISATSCRDVNLNEARTKYFYAICFALYNYFSLETVQI